MNHCKCGHAHTLLERMTFDQLYARSEPKRILRSKKVRGPPLEMESYQDSMYYYFDFKSYPSTTGLRWKGYVKFLKPRDLMVNLNRQMGNPLSTTTLDKVDCVVDCACFAPGTLVLMSDGVYKPISQIVPGDAVYTHKGRVRRVLGNVGRRLKKGENVYKIRVAGFPDDIYATGSHPFYTCRGNDTCRCGCGEKMSSDSLPRPSLLISRKYKKGHHPCRHRVENSVIEAIKLDYGTHKFSNEVLSKKYGVSKNTVQKITSGVLKPTILLTDENEFKFVKVEDFRKHEWFLTPWLEESKCVSLDSDLARFIGYYAAEGSFTSKLHTSINFTLNLDERDTLGEDISSIVERLHSKGVAFRKPLWGPNAENLFKIRPMNGTRLKRPQNAFTFTCYATDDFKQFIVQNVGIGSAAKKLSPLLMSADNETLRQIVIGLFLGDGHVRKNGYFRYTSISRDLVWNVSTILNRLKIKHCITAVGEGVLAIDIAVGKSCHEVLSWIEPFARNHVKQRIACSRQTDSRPDYYREDGCLRSLNSCVVDASYNDVVYDLCVEEDHTFIVHGVAVSNCPDYRYRWSWVNYQKDAGVIGPRSLNQCIDRAPRHTNPLGKPGLCKHLLAVSDYIYGQISNFAGDKPEDVNKTLDRLTKNATKRWINLPAEMQKARERDAKYARARELKRVGAIRTAAPESPEGESPAVPPSVPQVLRTDVEEPVAPLEAPPPGRPVPTGKEIYKKHRKIKRKPAAKPEPVAEPKPAGAFPSVSARRAASAGFPTVAQYKAARTVGDDLSIYYKDKEKRMNLMEAGEEVETMIDDLEAKVDAEGNDEGAETPEYSEGEQALELLGDIRDLLQKLAGEDAEKKEDTEVPEAPEVDEPAEDKAEEAI
jgi:hypothetical protein